jgi:NADH:ubiquinone oxidoreductase subunit 6 (subunit J)
VMGLLIVFLSQIALLLLALHALWHSFGSIASSEALSAGTAQWIRTSGFWFGATTLMMIASNPLNSLIASIGADEGRQFISISFESQHLLAFLLSAVLVVLGHVLALAADIADDNRQIV